MITDTLICVDCWSSSLKRMRTLVYSIRCVDLMELNTGSIRIYKTRIKAADDLQVLYSAYSSDRCRSYQ